ncbi:DUF3488 domain-containing protein, partial [Rubrivivax gelatinosus]|uniref:DUF3488 domain-containing protein n=1 Tax=Rubrivivax gelatinosus TaxID=28068 RepID=UPI002873C5C6
AGALAARAALLGAPVMVVLFLLFPRFGPLWGVPEDAAGRTGLSGTMRLGGVASVANDETIALRVRFDGAPPPPEAMYFRGPVLGRFDGVDWTRLPDVPAGARVQVLGTPRHYEMTLEPSRLAMLPLLELTPATAGPQLDGWSLRLRQDLQWQLDRPLSDRIRLQASAWTDYRHGPRRTTPELDDWRRLPPGYNPRTLAWAQALQARPELAGADARTLAAALLRHVADGGYGYTLEPGTYHRLPGHRPGAGGRLVDRAPEQRPRLGRILAARRRLATRRSDRRRRARACAARPQPAADAGPRRRHDRRGQPGARGAAARSLGDDQQPLEPGGAELLAPAPVRPAACAGRRVA